VEEALLSRARIRPARSREDLDRAADFLGTPRVKEIVEGHPEERGAVRICEADGELIGAILLDPTPIRLRDVDVRCIRILETAGEDGRSHFRRTGERDLFVLLLEEALGYVWIKRYPLVYVHGELALYPPHGFVPCFYHARVEVDVAAALTVPSPYRVRRLKADDVGPIQEMRRRFERSKPIVFAQGVPPFHHFCIEGPKRSIMGYLSVRLNAKSKWRPKLFAPEIEVKDRAAACTVLRHCAEKAHEAGLERMHFALGPGHPVARLCLELGGRATMKGAATDPFVDEEMLHVVDPVGLVAELAPYFERRLARTGAQETEATIPVATSAGTWQFRVESGAVSLETIESRPRGCLDIPHWAFTQLLAGYRGVSELDAPMPAEHAALLETILPKTWPLSLPDPDVWEDLQPPIPYTDEAALVVGETRLPWALRGGNGAD
jgi:hypothetical protein